jgi:hypothetical protein
MAIEVEGPDGVILEFPDGTSREVMAKAMSKRYPKGSAKPAPKAPEPSMAASFGKGLLSGAANALMAPAELLVQGMSALGIPGAKEGQARGAAGKARADRNLAAYRQTNPNAFAGGRLIGEVAASAPLIAAGGGAIQSGGRLLSEVAPSAGRVVQRVGAATKTGGIGSGRTAAQTAKMTRTARVGALAERAAGGAVGGGIGAAATGQNPIEGAAFGGALPIATAPVRKIAGGIVDTFRGGNKIRAAQMFRDALKTDIDAARAAFSSMAPDDQRLARKVLIDEGVEPDTFMALGADVERLRPQQVRLNQEAEMAAARGGLETAAGVAPGGSVTDVRAAVRGGRQAVSEQMSPVREAAFENIAGVNQAVSDAEMLAQSARARAAEQTRVAAARGDEARRMTGSAAFFEDSPAFTRGADIAASDAEIAAREAAAQRGIAADMEDFIHQAAAADVKPQRGAPLVAELRRMASQRGVVVDDLQRNTILSVAKKIESVMDENGMIDPYNMYQIRKTGVSDIIEGLQKKITAGTAPKSGNVERASSLAGSVRSLIDDTLGPEFKDYLSRSAQGYQAVNRQELAGEALKRFNAPGSAGFLTLVGRNEPETVAGIMQGGPQMEDIGNALSAQMSIPITKAADLLTNRNRMNELAASGATAANALMGQTPPRFFRLGSRLATAKVPGAGRVVDAASQLTGDLMDQNVRRRLSEGFMSGQNANDLLNTYATNVLTDAQISKLAPYQRNLLAQSIRNYFTTPSDQNAMAGY